MAKIRREKNLKESLLYIKIFVILWPRTSSVAKDLLFYVLTLSTHVSTHPWWLDSKQFVMDQWYSCWAFPATLYWSLFFHWLLISFYPPPNTTQPKSFRSKLDKLCAKGLWVCGVDQKPLDTKDIAWKTNV